MNPSKELTQLIWVVAYFRLLNFDLLTMSIICKEK